MVVGVLTLRLVFRESHSLKDKRRFVRSIKDRVRNDFNVSVSEVGEQDHLQLAELAFAMVGTDRAYVEGALAQVRNKARGFPPAEISAASVEYF
ncbi:MAG: DUF503 domain-containing protein [Planctomycetota bacterium]